MTPLRPSDRRSWSPRAPEPSCRLPTLAARVSRDRHHRRSHPCLAWQLPSERATPHGAPPPLTSRGHHRSPASGPLGRSPSPAPVLRRRSPCGSVDQGAAATAPLNLRTDCGSGIFSTIFILMSPCYTCSASTSAPNKNFSKCGGSGEPGLDTYSRSIGAHELKAEEAYTCSISESCGGNQKCVL